MRSFSGANGREEVGVYHYLARDAERTACGRVPAWNWFTSPVPTSVACKRCLASLARKVAA